MPFRRMSARYAQMSGHSICERLVLSGLRFAAAIAFCLLLAPPAQAEEQICRAPLAAWQPPTALVDKLTADGWQDIRVRIDDGCYKVRAVDAAGDRLERKFDPATLAPVLRHDDDD